MLIAFSANVIESFLNISATVCPEDEVNEYVLIIQQLSPSNHLEPDYFGILHPSDPAYQGVLFLHSSQIWLDAVLERTSPHGTSQSLFVYMLSQNLSSLRYRKTKIVSRDRKSTRLNSSHANI